MLDSVGDVSGRDVLDICCGTGHLAGAVAARGGRVTGIDFAPTMIEIARSKVAGANFQVGDAETLQFPPHEGRSGARHKGHRPAAGTAAIPICGRDRGATYAVGPWIPEHIPSKKHGSLDWDHWPTAPCADLQSNCQSANDYRGTNPGCARGDQAKHYFRGRGDAS
ncbi:MAG: class I SAM-dependent methyltransferase [Aestuariivirga sp.]